MFVFRVLLPIVFLAFAGLVIAYFVTKDRKYLQWAWRGAQGVLLVVVAFGLLYVFERVLLL
jgi:hypothetical protein